MATQGSKRLPPVIGRAARELTSDIVVWRKLRGLTQAQLADRAGVSKSTLRRLEHGDAGASLETVLRVSRALGVLDELAGSIDPQKTDLGRLRAEEALPQRVHPRQLGGTDA